MSEVLFLLLLVGAPSDRNGPYGIGRPATREEIKLRDISVHPSGAGLPPGRGTARVGRPLYAARCALCHGSRGEGQGDYPALAGGRGSLATHEPLLTVGSYWPYATTVWDYIYRAMPYDRPRTLSPSQVYAITAFVLYLNGIVGEDDVLDETNLAGVQMPNRAGFVADPRPDVRSRR